MRGEVGGGGRRWEEGDERGERWKEVGGERWVRWEEVGRGR